MFRNMTVTPLTPRYQGGAGPAPRFRRRAPSLPDAAGRPTRSDKYPALRASIDYSMEFCVLILSFFVRRVKQNRGENAYHFSQKTGRFSWGAFLGAARGQ